MIKSNELFKRIRAISLNGLASVEPMSTYCKPMWVNPQSIDTIIDLASEGARLAEAPLTPAQEHADEMLTLLRALNPTNLGGNWMAVRALLDKIDPPKPVTLDEAINALHEMADYTQPLPGALNTARDILRRFNKDVEYKVFATTKGEPLPASIPNTGDYGPGCVNHLSVQRYKALLLVGWTDALLIKHGLMK